MQPLPPRILLAGLGRFATQHLRVWRTLEHEGLAVLGGVLLRNPPAFDPGLPVFLSPNQIDPSHFDAIDIASSVESHPELIRHFLPHLHVLVEKPLAPSPAESREIESLAARSGNVLMVNHLFRFHPGLLRLQQIVRDLLPELPELIQVRLTNPVEQEVLHRDIQIEFLHVYDLIDSLFPQQDPPLSLLRRTELQWEASLLYANGVKANVLFGWEGVERLRELELHYPHRRFLLNLNDSGLLSWQADRFERFCTGAPPALLYTALKSFLDRIRGLAVPLPDATTGRRIVETARSVAPAILKPRPTVAIMGAGLFGACCALELAPDFDVTIFERHPGILTEATFNNQWRHHSGFHYPRSFETVKEIQQTKEEFRAVFGQEIIRDIPSFYCTSVFAREITRDRYLQACRANGLDFEITSPPDHVLDPSRVNLCLRTDEGVFDFHLLHQILLARLSSHPAIDLRLSTSVSDVRLDQSLAKVLTFQSANQSSSQSFDFVINATYTNKNLLATWLGLPIEPIRFDLCEMLVLELDLDPIAITILDGPFTSLVGTGNRGEFLLSHIHESILKSSTPPDGLPPAWGPFSSNREGLLRECKRYLPILSSARVLDSRFATRAVRANSEDYDGRPTVIRPLGFGCWSILGGKIVTSVSTARNIAQTMKMY